MVNRGSYISSSLCLESLSWEGGLNFEDEISLRGVECNVPNFP